MRCATAGLLVAALALAGADAARAAGRWTTYIRPYGVTDIEARADTVWCATDNAGLIQLDRATGTFGQITRAPGAITSNNLSAIAFDRSGRLWVGTRGGGLSVRSIAGVWGVLNVFDGLPSDTVTSVFVAGDTVWVGTTGGVLFWNGHEVSGVLPDGVNPSPFGSSRISGVLQTGDSVWVATLDTVMVGRLSQGLQAWTSADVGLPKADIGALVTDGRDVMVELDPFVFVWEGGTWVDSNAPGFVRRLASDNGVILASTESGVYRWDGATWAALDGAPVSDFSAKIKVAAAADPSGTAFVANFYGLLEQTATPGTWITRAFPGPPSNDLCGVVSDGRSTYMTSRSDGRSGAFGRLRDGVWLNWGPPTTPCASCTDRPYYPGGDSNFALLLDGQGLVWYSAWSFTIDRLDDSGADPVFRHFWVGTDTLGHTWGWSTLSDPAGGRWIGGDAPGIPENVPIGLDYYGPDGEFVTTYDRANTPELPSDQVRALAFDRLGELWVGSANYGGGGGVAAFTPSSTPGGPLAYVTRLGGLLTAEASDVFGVAIHGDSIWVLSADSLRFYPGRFAEHPVAFARLGPVAAPGSVHPIEVTRDGSVWVAADGGIRVFHPDATVEDLTDANSPLASGTVRSIFAEPGGAAIWITTNGGLNRYEPFYTPPAPQPLASLHVRVFPNPVMQTGIGFSLRLSGEGTSYRGAIYGIDGRRLRGIVVPANGAVAWDGRDDDGRLVRPGIYFLRVEAGGRAATARVAVLH